MLLSTRRVLILRCKDRLKEIGQKYIFRGNLAQLFRKTDKRVIKVMTTEAYDVDAARVSRDVIEPNPAKSRPSANNFEIGRAHV